MAGMRSAGKVGARRAAAQARAAAAAAGTGPTGRGGFRVSSTGEASRARMRRLRGGGRLGGLQRADGRALNAVVGRPLTMRRNATIAAGGAVGAGLAMNTVLGPRPPSAGRDGLRPGGSHLPY